MKKKAVFTIVACSIAVVFLSSILAIGLRSEGFGLERLYRQSKGEPVREDGKYRYTYTWDLEDRALTGLDIDWMAGNVEIKTGSGSSVVIEEACTSELKEGDELSFSSSGGVLEIKWNKSLLNFGLFSQKAKNLTVQVPRSALENWETLKCSTASANITASGLSAEKVELSTASGDLKLSRISGTEGEVSTTSGALEMEGGSFERFTANTTSGPITCLGVKAEKVGLNTVSGDLHYTGSAENLEANSISAPLLAELDACPAEASMNAVSGSLTLAIPENPGFEAHYSSVSGSFSSEFPTTGSTGKSGTALYSSGEAKLSFSTTSGAMRVNRR